jgi:hypothetical protein
MRRIGLAVVLALSRAAEAQDGPQKYNEPPALVPTRGRGARAAVESPRTTAFQEFGESE